MKGLITCIFLVLLFPQAQAQSYSLSHQVLVPAGSLLTSGGTSYQQTVGEAAVEIFVLYPFTITQGFQQPRFVPDNELPPVQGNGVVFFPNPLNEQAYYLLNIRIYGDVGRTYNVIITNFSGAIVFTTKIDLFGLHDYVLPVDMNSMANGIYIGRVMSTDGIINRSFKIDKL